MKKRITLIFAVIFALALAVCGSTAAFAAEESETINWDFGGEPSEYKLLGEAKEGKTTIPAETEGYGLCYEFNAPESGYYLVTFCSDDFGWIGFPEAFDNGYASGNADNVWVNGNYYSEILYYLEEGKTCVGTDHYYSDEETSFEIEYIGSKITDLSFGKEAFTDYLIYADINYYYDDGYDFIAWEDATVKFDSGKTLKIKDCELLYNAKNDEIVNGTNEITVSLLGYEENINMTACTVDKFVSKVEMTNIEDYYMVVQYYDGYVVPEICDEEATVYFTDGTKSTIDFEYGYGTIKLPNGRKYEIYASYETVRSNQLSLVFYVAYEEITAYECGIETTDFIENFKLLHENKINIINNVTARIRREYADYIWCSDSALEFIQNFPVLFETCYNDSLWSLYDLMCNDIAFLSYVTTGETVEW